MSVYKLKHYATEIGTATLIYSQYHSVLGKTLL